ncbi:MAG: site-2 protease family protein, partial [Rhodospirillaceae bacterium]|nr:site-2 protease family protein [Rhodospirillaceae bacterium]
MLDPQIMSIATLVAIVAIPMIFAITVHEVAHGWVALHLGDPTAKYAGRLTLNPIKHIDPLGTIIVPFVMVVASSGLWAFGWAKPVPVAFQNLRNPRRDMILVAAAGPAVFLA